MFHFFIRLQSATLFCICLASAELNPKIDASITFQSKSDKNSNPRVKISITRNETPTSRALVQNISMFIYQRLNSADVKRSLSEFLQNHNARAYIPIFNLKIPTHDPNNLSPIVTDRYVIEFENDNFKLNNVNVFLANATNAENDFLSNDIGTDESGDGTSESDIELKNLNEEQSGNRTAIGKETSNNKSVDEFDLLTDLAKLSMGNTNKYYSEIVGTSIEFDTYESSLDYDETKQSSNKDKSKTPEEFKKYFKIMNRKNRIMNVLRKQRILLREVANVLRDKKQDADNAAQAAKDFKSLTQDLEMKQAKIPEGVNLTQAAEESIRKKLAQEKGSSETKIIKEKIKKPDIPAHAAMDTLIDETEVRSALKKDPYVQRILKMSKMRKEMYFEQARKSFTA